MLMHSIATVQLCLFEKPYLFKNPGCPGKWDPSNGCADGVDPADSERYAAACKDVMVAYNAIEAGEPVPPHPSGLSAADNLAEVQKEWY